jgi:hypothetical protein
VRAGSELGLYRMRRSRARLPTAQAPGSLSFSALSTRTDSGSPGCHGSHGHACRPLEETSGCTCRESTPCRVKSSCRSIGRSSLPPARSPPCPLLVPCMQSPVFASDVGSDSGPELGSPSQRSPGWSWVSRRPYEDVEALSWAAAASRRARTSSASGASSSLKIVSASCQQA